MSQINSDISKASLPKAISTLRYKIENYISKSIERAGVKGLVTSHGNILVQLYKEDKQTMAKIAQDIGRCKSTLTVLVDKLEKIGFITREADTKDTRIKKLCLTEEGKAFQNNFWQISNNLNTVLWKNFTKEEQEQCLQFFDRLNENLTQSLDEKQKNA